jgi:sugar/nucleoside kinase (ribokinase family)
MAIIGCAGILVVDTFCGPVDALPEQGQLLSIETLPVKAGGCAANVAISLKKQGLDVDVAGCIGDDAPGRVLLDTFDRIGIGHSGIKTTDQVATSQTIVLLVRGQDRRFLHLVGANGLFRIEDISRDWLSGLEVFYLGGLFVLPGVRIESLVELLAFCRENGVVTVLDVVVPSGMTQFDGLNRLLPLVDFFVPNEDEARLMTGTADPRDQLIELRALGARATIITCGDNGLVASDNSDFALCVKGYEAKVVDPTGSGDAFTSGLITGVTRGFSFEDVLAYACALGMSATRGVGTTDTVFDRGSAERFIANTSLSIERWNISKHSKVTG